MPSSSFVRTVFLWNTNIVCEAADISLPELLHEDRQADLLIPLHMTLYLTKCMTGATNKHLARLIDSHSTSVMRGIQAFREAYAEKHWVRELFETVLDEDSLAGFYYRAMKRMKKVNSEQRQA